MKPKNVLLLRKLLLQVFVKKQLNGPTNPNLSYIQVTASTDNCLFTHSADTPLQKKTHPIIVGLSAKLFPF